MSPGNEARGVIVVAHPDGGTITPDELDFIADRIESVVWGQGFSVDVSFDTN